MEDIGVGCKQFVAFGVQGQILETEVPETKKAERGSIYKDITYINTGMGLGESRWKRRAYSPQMGRNLPYKHL